jgi:hypothetical protein
MDQSVLQWHLRFIPMLLQLSTPHLQRFAFYLKIDLSATPPVLDIVYAKNKHLTREDSRLIRHILEMVQDPHLWHSEGQYLREVIFLLSTFSTQKLDVICSEMRLHTSSILRHVHERTDRSTGHLGLDGTSGLNSEQVLKSRNPTEILELLLEKVNLYHKSRTLERLESLCQFAFQLSQETEFWELGKASPPKPELKECYSKLQWLIGLLGVYPELADKCYSFFKEHHDPFLSQLRMIAAKEPNKDGVVRLCSALTDGMTLLPWKSIPLGGGALTEPRPERYRHDWVGRYLDTVLRRARIILPCSWIQLLEAHIKLGLHYCGEVEEICHRPEENWSMFPYGETPDIIDGSWGEVVPTLPPNRLSFSGRLRGSTFSPVGELLDKAVWESVAVLREENKLFWR